mmetsp:Transcript_3046/g.9541  ORF Transcript_3046/g.9541 Transcript_3046/m.9541 type:complete len:212 (+) Transcript_3046:822-1457(+)
MCSSVLPWCSCANDPTFTWRSCAIVLSDCSRCVSRVWCAAFWIAVAPLAFWPRNVSKRGWNVSNVNVLNVNRPLCFHNKRLCPRPIVPHISVLPRHHLRPRSPPRTPRLRECYTSVHPLYRPESHPPESHRPVCIRRCRSTTRWCAPTVWTATMCPPHRPTTRTSSSKSPPRTPSARSTPTPRICGSSSSALPPSTWRSGRSRTRTRTVTI